MLEASGNLSSESLDVAMLVLNILQLAVTILRLLIKVYLAITSLQQPETIGDKCAEEHPSRDSNKKNTATSVPMSSNPRVSTVCDRPRSPDTSNDVVAASPPDEMEKKRLEQEDVSATDPFVHATVSNASSLSTNAAIRLLLDDDDKYSADFESDAPQSRSSLPVNDPRLPPAASEKLSGYFVPASSGVSLAAISSPVEFSEEDALLL